jgi:hypothetical protein
MELYSSNIVFLKKLLLSAGIILVTLVMVVLVSTHIVTSRAQSGEATRHLRHLPTIGFKATPWQQNAQTTPFVFPLKTVSDSIFPVPQFINKQPKILPYTSSRAASPSFNTFHTEYLDHQAQWNWQLAAAKFSRDDINAEFAHLEQRIAANMVHMLRLILFASAVAIAVMVIGGGLIARYVTQRMLRNNLAPENLAPENLAPENLPPENLPPENLAPENLPPENLPLESTDQKISLRCVTQVNENKTFVDDETESTRQVVATHITTVEEGSRLISDSEMTLDAILTAMQQVGDAVAEMTISHREHIGGVTPSVQTPTDIALLNNHKAENKTTEAALEDQALTLRQLMACLVSYDEDNCLEQQSVIKPRVNCLESETVTATSVKTVANFPLH